MFSSVTVYVFGGSRSGYDKASGSELYNGSQLQLSQPLKSCQPHTYTALVSCLPGASSATYSQMYLVMKFYFRLLSDRITHVKCLPVMFNLNIFSGQNMNNSFKRLKEVQSLVKPTIAPTLRTF